MGKPIPLAVALKHWFDADLAGLPADVRGIVEHQAKVFHPCNWDELTALQRRVAAQTFDAQRPTTLVDKRAAKEGFREGFKKVSVPRRNKANAKRPRPSRQKVSDADIQRIAIEVLTSIQN